jgi:hypothetical protein
MRTHKLRYRLAGAASVGAAALAATLMFGGVAQAATPSDPVGGATPVAPHFYNGNVEAIRDSGSDTTFFLMQKLGDLYTGAGLYGCTLDSSVGQTLFNSSDPAVTATNQEGACVAGGNVPTTDTSDNWDRTEISEGVDDVGSGAGQGQLCGSTDTPLPVDFARSSKPAGTACATLAETGYAKDGVPITDYPINPSIYGTSTNSAYSSINGGNFGPVASGWLPGDPVNGPYNGTALTDIDNTDNGGGANSTAYRIWCATGATEISDWGQLTNLGPNLAVVKVTTNGTTTLTLASAFPTSITAGDAVSGPGIPSGDTVASISGSTITLNAAATASGTVTLSFNIGTTLAVGAGYPVGIAVRPIGLNTASGTEATFSGYAESGVSGGGCASNMNTDSPADPNSATAPSPNGAHIALENNSDQLDQFASADFPSPDYVDQAIEVSTTLYIMSNGVMNTNSYAAASTIDGTQYSANKVTENGVATTTPNLLQNKYPTARTLFNIYRTDTVRASAAGFLNWICDGDVNFNKGLDNSTGKNFDTEVNTLIATTYGFPRLTDESTAPTIGTPADNQAAPNNTCSAALPTVVTTSGSTTVSLASGSFPADIVSAGGLTNPNNTTTPNVSVSGTGIPAGATVVSNNGTTLTLSAAATASGTVALQFYGVPSITAVGSSQN